MCVRRCKKVDVEIRSDDDDNKDDPPVANGSGDPHLTTFDGRKFDFQGVANKHYVVFSRSNGGDRLVTRMRASPFSNHGVKATYFDAFGLSTNVNGDSVENVHKIQIETVPRSNSDKQAGEVNESDKDQKWSVRVNVNGKVIDNEGEISLGPDNEGDATTMAIEKDGAEIVKVAVTTRDASYSVRAKKMWRVTRHLDISVNLRHTPAPDQFVYDGLLGHTLNKIVYGEKDDNALSLLGKTTGREVEGDVDADAEKKLELAMRAKFETSSLFPDEATNNEVKLQPVSRMSKTRPVELMQEDIGLSASIAYDS